MRATRKLIRSRRGISMVEVIVAMAVVLIVTGAAMSVFAASARADVNFRDKTAALDACESAAECIRFAQDDPALLSDVLGKVGFVRDDASSTWRFESGGETVLVYLENEKTYVVKYGDKKIYEYDIYTTQQDS